MLIFFHGTLWYNLKNSFDPSGSGFWWIYHQHGPGFGEKIENNPWQPLWENGGFLSAAASMQ